MTGDRWVGTPNKFTVVFKDAVRIVYEGIGSNEVFAEWAKKNLMGFYQEKIRRFYNFFLDNNNLSLSLACLKSYSRTLVRLLVQ